MAKGAETEEEGRIAICDLLEDLTLFELEKRVNIVSLDCRSGLSKFANPFLLYNRFLN